MNFVLLFSYLEEIAAAGPDALKLIKDVVRAFNDYRSGKLTQDEFQVIFTDLAKLADDFFGAKKAA